MTFPDAFGLTAGDHVCVFYRGREQRDRLLAPFLLEGLRAEQKCLYVGPDPQTDPLVPVLRREAGPNLLEVEDTTAHYLRDDAFAAADLLRFWDDFAQRSYVDEGRSFGRAACEVSWVQGLPADQMADFLAYEKDVTTFCRAHPQVALCLYDLTDLPGSLILAILDSHPKVLFEEMVVENPYWAGAA